MAASALEMSPTKSAALRDALVDLMRRAGTELNVGEAEVLVTALSAEISGRVSADRKVSTSSKDPTRSPTKSESSVSLASLVSVNDRRHEAEVATGSHSRNAMNSETTEHGGDGGDEVDGFVAHPDWNPNGVASLAQEAEIVYADDGYQSTSGLATIGTARIAQEEWNENSEWLEKHREAADVLTQHPELIEFVSELLSRQDELESALSRTEHELKRREQEHLHHVQYLEDLSLVQIEEANRKAEEVTNAARRGAAMLSPEAAYEKLVQELDEKETQLSQLKHQQDKLRDEMKERDYLHSQSHSKYAEEQQQLIQELTGMRRTLDDIRQRSMRRKKHNKAVRSASALVEEFAKEELKRNDLDQSDLAASVAAHRVTSDNRATSRTSSVMDAYVGRNGPAMDHDAAGFHSAPLAASTPDVDHFLDDDDSDIDIISRLTGVVHRSADASEDAASAPVLAVGGDRRSVSSSDTTQWAFNEPTTAEQHGVVVERERDAVTPTAPDQDLQQGFTVEELQLTTDNGDDALDKTSSNPLLRIPDKQQQLHQRIFDPLRDDRPASQGAASTIAVPMVASSSKPTSRSAAAMLDDTMEFPANLKPRSLRPTGRGGSTYRKPSDSSDDNHSNNESSGSENTGGGEGGKKQKKKRKVKRWMTLPSNLGRLGSAKLEWRKAGETAPATGNLGSVYRTPARPQEPTDGSGAGAAVAGSNGDGRSGSRNSNSRSSPALPSSGRPGSGLGGQMRIFNVAILGDSGVGKTTFIHRFANQGRRQPHGIPPATIGVDYVVKNAIIADQTVTLKLWDTAGTERFHSLAQNYLRRCDGVILMFDITKRSTFEGVRKWQSGVLQTCREGATLMVVGNKVDLVEDGLAVQAVSAHEGVVLAHSMNNGMYMESSGRRGVGVDEACSILTKAMLAKEDEELQGSTRVSNFEESIATPRQNQCCKTF
eukprot:scpid26388/ scgid0095/ Ras and EF-hand domain-containing protein homolog